MANNSKTKPNLLLTFHIYMEKFVFCTNTHPPIWRCSHNFLSANHYRKWRRRRRRRQRQHFEQCNILTMWFLSVYRFLFVLFNFHHWSRHFSKCEENPFHPWYLHNQRQRHCRQISKRSKWIERCEEAKKEKEKKISHDRKEIIRFLVLLVPFVACSVFCVHSFTIPTQIGDIHGTERNKNDQKRET